ncbi:MAG: 2-methylcitrate dehydratase [Devosia sp. 67-54]|nr:MmgE/PrpD family protein [Devosia sp.]OJX17107.1 MAG: 2-methylcitrate dehydratase [Devosia sp. 67-54]
MASTWSSADQIDRRSVVHRLAAYVTSARGRPVQAQTAAAVRRSILDLLGAAAAGVQNSGASAVRATAITTMAEGTVPIWFSGLCSSAVGAAWANSAAAAAVDLDDGHRMARGHPGAAVIPTAIALAHETGASLTEVVGAIVIGYEVGVTIGAARLTYGNTGTWSSYAVVATAAALRRTESPIIAHALAIAGESAPNQLFASAPPQPLRPEGSDVKEGIAWSVVTGLTALRLAEAGHTGPRNILDSTLHYRFPVDLGLGASQHIGRSYFKLYACCRHVHAPLECLLNVIQQHRLDPRAIEAIEVQTYSGALRIANSPRPRHLVDVQYSIPYCLALAALVGQESLLPLGPEALGRKEVEVLAERVSVTLDPVLDARFPTETLARVIVVTAGRRFVSEVMAPRGEASSPLTWGELEAKFIAASAGVLGQTERMDLLRSVGAMENGELSPLLDDLRRLSLTRRQS